MNVIACIRQSSDTSNENHTPSLFPQGFTVTAYFLISLKFFPGSWVLLLSLSTTTVFSSWCRSAFIYYLGLSTFKELCVFFGFCLNSMTSARYSQRMLYLLTIHHPPLCSQETYGRCSQSLFYPLLFHPFPLMGFEMNCRILSKQAELLCSSPAVRANSRRVGNWGFRLSSAWKDSNPTLLPKQHPTQYFEKR